jgi:hypothetical protein
MADTGLICPFKDRCITQCALFIPAPVGKDSGTCSIKAIANLLDHLNDLIGTMKTKIN